MVEKRKFVREGLGDWEHEQSLLLRGFDVIYVWLFNHEVSLNTRLSDRTHSLQLYLLFSDLLERKEVV